MGRTKRSSKALWRTIGLVSLASTLVLLFGFGYALNDLLNPKVPASSGNAGTNASGESPFVSTKEYRITAIGDSLTKGTGDETGEGYVKQTAVMLKEKTGKPVTVVNNLSINGMLADQLADKLDKDKGYRYSLQQANLILLTIGGNDLFAFAQTGEEGSGTGGINPALQEGSLQEGLRRLDTVLKKLEEINPKARIVYVGLYNPFYDVKDLRAGSISVQTWNSAAYRLVHRNPNGILVPTFDLFEGTIGSYLSSDHFHPNHDGYTQIAKRIVQVLE